jgi:hypothetical protein
MQRAIIAAFGYPQIRSSIETMQRAVIASLNVSRYRTEDLVRPSSEHVPHEHSFSYTFFYLQNGRKRNDLSERSSTSAESSTATVERSSKLCDPKRKCDASKKARSWSKQRMPITRFICILMYLFAYLGTKRTKPDQPCCPARDLVSRATAFLVASSRP